MLEDSYYKFEILIEGKFENYSFKSSKIQNYYTYKEENKNYKVLIYPTLANLQETICNINIDFIND